MRAQAVETRVNPGALESLDALAFPGEVARGQPWQAEGLLGRRYATLDPRLAERVPDWLATLSVPEGTVLKAPDVHRIGALVVKFFRQRSLFGWVRPPRAVRSAERYFWCLPLRSPRPLLAAGRRFGARSLLVREHVSGTLLFDLWRSERWDARCEEALVAFLAGMERHGVVHGDLHPRNVLWNGTEWVLLDVDGLRHRLHDPERVLVGQWARFVLHLGDEPRVRVLFRRAAGQLGDTRVTWEAVRRRVEALESGRSPLRAAGLRETTTETDKGEQTL